jgi:malonyl-CoA O-methyltransferase
MLKQEIIRHKLNANTEGMLQLDFIFHEIAKRMLERLEYIKLVPQAILDIGSGLGIDAQLLQLKYPKSRIYKVDFSINALKRYNQPTGWINRLITKNRQLVCASAVQLPIASQSINLAWSNLTLPYIEHLDSYFKEIRRVLTLGGAFLITGLAVDSLEQLREVGLTTYNFPDMHVIGDILVQLGFTNPVTDIEYLTLEYDDFRQLLADIRLIGCGAAASRRSTLTKTEYNALEHKFAKLTKKGKLPLTLEVFYAHAWKDKVSLDLAADQKIIQFYL